MTNSGKRFRELTMLTRRDRGATAVEYALIVGLIAVVIIVAVVVLGGRLSGIFGNTANSLTAAGAGGSGGGGGGGGSTLPTNLAITSYTGGGSANLSWTAATGATQYQWEFVDENNSFTCNSGAFGAEQSGSTSGTSATANSGTNTGQWGCFRVRVSSPTSGSWVYSTTVQR